MKTVQITKTTIFLLLFCVLMPIQGKAQKINSFSEYKIIESEYGGKKIRITPHSKTTNVGKDESKYQKNWSVYGVLICYTVDGKKKVKRQDMTFDLKKQGYYETILTYGDNASLGVVSVTYFNMVEQPKEDWPKKESCL
ncbi:hypothetical protein [Aquimarina brevivitae]|uniref:Uncharacterized protein n=1 Tax=Aquimarina brevivitae TaxID=323412 RepID=A0A4Q7NVS5_9FLAO|nr:hypothetical protein [Aquimarina brevivitae]RZS90502.1 hypothetical protein EV197_3491 [Aquimarina brevivitae]